MASPNAVAVRVLQQLEADVVRGQPLRCDAGPDDHCDEQPGAEELGEQASAKRGTRSGILVCHAQILTDQRCLSQY